MPVDPRDVVEEATDAVIYQPGRNIRRLTRYGLFYRRLNSGTRIGGLFDRLFSAAEVSWGFLLGLLAMLWGIIAHRGKHRPSQD